MVTCLALTAALCAFVAGRPVGEDAVDKEKERVAHVVADAAQTFLKNGQTVGLSIGVIQDGKTCTYDFGTTERGKARQPTAHTRYAIASITKTFTGALLACAVEEKRARLDDDIRRYMDGDYPNLEYQGHPIRLWQLINHTSGLPRGLPEDADQQIGADDDVARRSVREAAFQQRYTRDDFLRDLHNIRLDRLPGTKFSYSNAAAQLLGLILERVYGISYEQLLRQKITGPLHMGDTKVTLTPADIARLPRAYSASGSGTAFLPALPTRFPAAGSLYSTTTDMLKYLAWNIAEKDEAVQLSHRPAGDTVWDKEGNFTVGLNWQILRYADNKRVLFQDGNVPGFHSMCAFSPELKLGIIVLTNEEVREKPAQLSPLINQILQGIDPRMPAVP